MRSPYRKWMCCLCIMLPATCLFAQQAVRPADKLVEEGIQLHEAEKYTEAIEKFTEALKLNPKKARVEYELALALEAADQKQEAIKHLENLLKVKSRDVTKAEVYDILGCIYDDLGEPAKAIEMYKAGIKNDPKFGRIYCNMGITCLREKRYAEAESAAETAIQLDPKHAASQWLYAMVNYYQGRRVNAIIAISSYLLMEPESERGAKAFRAMQNLLNAGFTDKSIELINAKLDEDIALNPQPEPAAVFLAKKAAAIALNKPAPVDALQAYLTVIFESTGEQPVSSKENRFFRRFYADYFYKLRLSGNMPAFARYISMSAFKQENLQWFVKNPELLQEFDTWLDTTRRKF